MIISVQFQSRDKKSWGERKYSYFCDFPVHTGDLVKVLAGKEREEKIVRVAEINVPESRVDDRILAVMKSVLSVAEEAGAKEALA